MRGFTTITLGFLTAVVSAGVVLKPRDGDQRPWVTVDASGTAQTITPTQDGGSTFTGSVATPTAQPDGSGSFLVCAPESGSTKFRPFCAPQNNAVVDPDTTYFGMFLALPGFLLLALPCWPKPWIYTHEATVEIAR